MNGKWRSIGSEAVRFFRSDMLRTILAAMCISVGSTVLVAVLSLVRTLDAETQNLLHGLGRNSIVVTRNGFGLRSKQEKLAIAARHIDVRQDMRFIANYVPTLAGMTPRLVRVGVAKNANREVDQVTVSQVNSSFAELIDLEVVDGRFFTEREVLAAAPVAVVGPSLAEALFPGQRAIGQEVLLFNLPFRVIGIFEKRGSMFGNDLDKWVVIPLGSGPKLMPNESEEMVLTFKPGTSLEESEDEVLSALQSRYGTEGLRDAGFEVVNLGNLLHFLSNLFRASFAFAVIIGSIVFLVGGLGVMNTLLVALDARVSEIGVMKAVGATNYQVLCITLVESLLIVSAGAICSATLLPVLQAVIKITWTGFNGFNIAWQLLPINLLAVGLIGVFFGFYPALKAGRMSVVDCLRQGRT